MNDGREYIYLLRKAVKELKLLQWFCLTLFCIVALSSPSFCLYEDKDVEDLSSKAIIVYKSSQDVFKDHYQKIQQKWEQKLKLQFLHDIEDPEYVQLITLYKNQMSLSTEEDLSLREKEKDLLEDIFQTVDSLKEHLKDSESLNRTKNIRRCLRDKICESIYDFLFYRVQEAQAFCDRHKHDLDKPEYRQNHTIHKRLIFTFLNQADVKKALEKLENTCPILTVRPKTLSTTTNPNIGCYSNANLPIIAVGHNVYIKPLLDLTRALLVPLTPQNIQGYAQELERPLNQLRAFKYYPETVSPLCHILQRVSNLGSLPLLTPTDEKQFQYLQSQLYFLGHWIPKWIPYDLVDIAKEDIEEAERNLKTNRTSIRQRDIEILLYGRIPWKALQNIYGLIHQSSRENFGYLNGILRDALPDMEIEFFRLYPYLKDLIDYQVLTYTCNHPTLPMSKRTQFENLSFLGNYWADLTNLQKIKEYITTIRHGYSSCTQHVVRNYAFIRSLEVLGESGKNLTTHLQSRSGKEFWKQIGRLRNLFAHLERSPIAERLKELVSAVHSKIFQQIIEYSFKELEKWLDIEIDHLQKLTDWQKIKKFYSQQKKGKKPLEGLTKGVEKLLDILESPLSLQGREALEATLYTRDTNLHEIKTAIIREFLIERRRISDQPELFEKIEKLPLKGSQKRRLQVHYKNLDPKVREANRNRQIEETLKKIDDHHPLKQEIREGLLQSNQSGNKKDFIRQIETLTCLSNKDKKKLIEAHVLLNDSEARKEEEEAELKEIQSILDEIKVFSQEEAESEGYKIIDTIGSGSNTNWQMLNAKLDELSITQQKVWEDTHKKISKKQQKAENSSLPNSNEKSFQKIIKSGSIILSALNTLDQITKPYRDASQQKNIFFENNPLLFYACESVVASFRRHSIIIENVIDLLKRFQKTTYSARALHQVITDLRSELKGHILKSNALLHVHDVTEPTGTLPAGQRFKMFLDLMYALDGFPFGKGQSIPSLKEKISLCIKEASYQLDKMKKKKVNETHLDQVTIYTFSTGIVVIPPSSVTRN